MSDKEIIRVLELGEKGELPDQIVDGMDIAPITKELYEAGYISALNASDLNQIDFMNPKITVAGREHLKRLRKEATDATLWAKVKKTIPAIIGWFAGIASTLIVQWLTK